MEDRKHNIAIVGHPLCGKDTVGEYIYKRYGYAHVPTGQLLRDYIAENDLGEPTRDLMKVVANDVRKQFGSDYFVKRALEISDGKVVINGIRTVGEIEAAKGVGCVILAITAPAEKRYEWSQQRKRISDNVTFEQFFTQEESETMGKSRDEQNVQLAIDTADYVIVNDKNLGSLYHEIDKYMNSLKTIE